MSDNKVFYERARDIYTEICYASNNGKHRGMRIGDIREKYGLKKRDIKVLLKFLDDYAEFKYDDEYVAFDIYKVASEQQQEDKLALLDYDDIDTDEEHEWNWENFDNDCFIHYNDSLSVICDKINEDNVDITDISLLKKIESDPKFRKKWHEISPLSLNKTSVIDKGEHFNKNQEYMFLKKKWIRAIVKSNKVDISEYGKRADNVWPFGLYYDHFLKCYHVVYLDEKNIDTIDPDNMYENMKDTLLSEIKSVNVCDDESVTLNKLRMLKANFNIYEYIKFCQVETMKLKVYKEGNVIYKLRELLRDNQCEITEYDEFTIFEFRTDDPEEYLKRLNSYGRSVIVLEPVALRDEVVESIEKTLRKYKLLSGEE